MEINEKEKHLKEDKLNSFYVRYTNLKLLVKQYAYENAALNQEIENTESKLIIAKNERKCLLRKLLQFEKPENKTAKLVSTKASVSHENCELEESKRTSPDVSGSTELDSEEKSGYGTCAATDNAQTWRMSVSSLTNYAKELKNTDFQRKYSTTDNSNDDDLDSIDIDLEGTSNDMLADSDENVFVIQPYEKTDKNSVTTPQLQLDESIALVESLPKWKVVGQNLYPLKNAKRPYIFQKTVFDEIQRAIRANSNITSLFVSVEQLTPAQKINFEDICGIKKIFDRYTLVLQIFKLRMKTKQAKLQVALAEIPYMKSNVSSAILTPNSNHQHQGFVSETYHEKLRKEFHAKERRLRKHLQVLNRNRSAHRVQRKKTNVPIVAVVGYTNAGKTSLIKALTESERAQPKDQLFATLDVTAHAATFPNQLRYVLIDTVGFLSNLPHALFDAFSTTMEDMLQADVIVHIRDISHPDRKNQLRNVLEILSKLRLDNELLQNVVEVRNKIDVIPQSEFSLPKVVFPKLKKTVIQPGKKDLRPVVVCPVSVTRGDGMAALIEQLQNVVMRTTGRNRFELVVPAAGEHHNWLRKNCAVESVAGEGDFKLRLLAVLTQAQLNKFTSNFDDVVVLRNLSENTQSLA